MSDLQKLAAKTDSTEFYSPVPENYQKGKTKFIIISGSVMSGVGKGVFTSCIGTLFTCHGLNISPIKFDGYLNCDAGTLNPYRHGEVFVLDDGTECDLDMGSYERFLNKNFNKNNYLTAGKIFKTIIDREREGGYLGRDVQFIPHVTGEIKRFLRTLAMQSGADIVLVEVGGTVGDLENSYFLEAMRELRYEEGPNNVCFVNVTYIIEPKSLGEHKSKAAQLGLRKLMEMGIQPDVVVCRSTTPISTKIREKISIYSNIPVERVIGLHDADTVYDIPLNLKKQGVDRIIFDILKVHHKENGSELNFEKWEDLVNKIKTPKFRVTIGITGKYTNVKDSYLSILNALEHTAPYLGMKADVKWIETTEIDRNNVQEAFEGVDGIIVPGGFGKRGTEGKIECIRYARENKIPYFGLCLGFQLAIVEFARNVCGLQGANSTEMEENLKHPVIDILPEQKKIEGLGGNMRLGGKEVEIKNNTLAMKLYGKSLVRERFRHRYECNPEYIEMLEKNGMLFSGKAPKYNIMQIMELPEHPYFLGTQFHPEFTSKPLAPSPLFMGFLKAILKQKHAFAEKSSSQTI